MKATTREVVININSIFEEVGKGDMCVYFDTKDNNFIVNIKTSFTEKYFEIEGSEEDVSLLVRELVALGFDKENLHWGFHLDRLEVSKVSYAC